jgi:hypothetical protein
MPAFRQGLANAPARQRQVIFRLLFPYFEQMIAGWAREHHSPVATLWRLLVETWLRRQGLMTVC